MTETTAPPRPITILEVGLEGVGMVQALYEDMRRDPSPFFHVLGDLSALTADAGSATGREPDTVTSDELLESASRLVADIVADVRASTGDVPPRRGNL